MQNGETFGAAAAATNSNWDVRLHKMGQKVALYAKKNYPPGRRNPGGQLTNRSEAIDLPEIFGSKNDKWANRFRPPFWPNALSE